MGRRRIRTRHGRGSVTGQRGEAQAEPDRGEAFAFPAIRTRCAATRCVHGHDAFPDWRVSR